MTFERIDPPDLAPPRGFSHAVRTDRPHTVYLAGQTALDASGRIVGDDVVAQFEQALSNFLRALEAAGGTPADLFAGLRDKIGRWWDLPAIDAECADFVAHHRDARPAGTPVEAFAAYVPLLTRWRRLPYLDPGLPLELLPRPWHGAAAAELFADLDAELREPARAHALATLRS